MRRALLATFVLAAIAASCSGGVDTKAPPGDDDDAATTLTPTPTGTATGTPTPSGLAGAPWSTTATPALETCGVGTVQLPYGNAGAATIGVATTGGNLYFDVGLHLNPAIAVGDEPSGTFVAGGAFTQTFSYCFLDAIGANTRKVYANWAGTFAADMLSFNDSNLAERMYSLSGNHLANCATAITTANTFLDCSSSDMTFVIDGVKQ